MRLVEKLRRIEAPAVRDPGHGRGFEATGLPGELVDGPDGRYWRRHVRLPLTHRHGEVRLLRATEAPPARFAEVARDPRVADLGWDRAVFFDTETTALGGGAGTYVFLVGFGYYDGDSFVVEQLFLHDMTGERALLDAVNRRLSRFGLVVTFYGKGFDAPRLKDRLRFHRLEPAFPDPHLDLCIVGRSLFRGAFADCRLQTFERELLGFERADDLPGAECPRAFFGHLQGDSSLIPRVFEHNLLDVLALPAVLARFADEVAAPRHPVVRSNLGWFHESVGRDREARGFYADALDGLRRARHALLPRTLERLALLERRAGRHTVSADLLRERNGIAPYAFQPLEDLAKFYEHRARDLRRAEETALDARSRLLAGRIEVSRPVLERHLRSLDHRLGRLRRRLGGD